MSDRPVTVTVPALLTVHDIAKLGKVCTGTVWRNVKLGRFPPPITGYMGRSTRWLATDYAEYIERLKGERGDA